MECNKDEAMRAKEIAEKKFGAKDFEGARKFALKAQNLFPGLEGLSQMLATFDVYICASSQINGEADWYSILGINPSADDETVKKRYRKLALGLHPDKNKSIGAEGAFQLITEALSMLSDKSNRALYDQRRSRFSQQKTALPQEKRKFPPKANGLDENAKSKVSTVKRNAFQVKNPPHSGTALKTKSDTFWTICYKCSMQYEYLRLYNNQNLLCQQCLNPFFAIETPTPSPYDLRACSPWNSIHQQRKSHFKSASMIRTSDAISGGFGDAHGPASCRWIPSSQSGSSYFAHPASAAQKSYEEAVKEFEEALASKSESKGMKRKYDGSEKFPGCSPTEVLNSAKKKREMEESGLTCKKQSSGLTCKKQSSLETAGPSQANRTNKPCGVLDLSRREICNILVEKARSDIWKYISANKSSVAAARDKAGEKAHGEDKGIKTVAATGPVISTSKYHSMCVQDSEFYDFDKDRIEHSFQDNQVWAAYDNDDGMPRFYAIIHSVLSRNPFKMRISWLNSKTNAELGSLNWIGSGFTKTCGDFRVGKHEVNGSLNSFSHVVQWKKDARGAIRIFPRKGDVWALYQNWSPDWNEQTPNEIIHQYDMVEVIEDCDEELGVVVTPLTKVPGFKTLFRQQMELTEAKKIPKEEMFRFSHQVPRHYLASQVGYLKGCMELDPAATPAELPEAEKSANYEENVVDGVKRDSEKTQQILRKHEDAGELKEEKV